MEINNHYNKKLKNNARKLRKQMTKAEACLWKFVLSKRRVKNYQFRRQRPIDKYIVDFACLPLKIIIEVDGISHEHSEIAKNDIIRQKRLESLGFKVLRFTDDEVLTAIDRVAVSIEHSVEERHKELEL